MNARRVAVGVGAWNSHNASPADLDRYVVSRLHAGDVAIVLTEVWTRQAALRSIADRYDLRLLSEPTRNRQLKIVPEHGDTAVLTVPTRFRLHDWQPVALEHEWMVFDTNRVHEPRRLIHALGELVELDDRPFELLGVHGPTGANVDAVAEFKGKTAEILTRSHDDVLSVAAGDFNIRLREARAWAREHDLRVSGRGPDLAAVHGGRVTSRRGERGTSDHFSMRHRVTARGGRR